MKILNLKAKIRFVLSVFTICASLSGYSAQTANGSKGSVSAQTADDTKGRVLYSFKSYEDARYTSFSDMHELGRANATRYLSTNKDKITLECSEVTIETSVTSEGTGPWSSVNNVYVAIYCNKTRLFGDQALLSLGQSCVKNPQPECFDNNVLQKLNSVNPKLDVKYIRKQIE